MRYTQCFKTMRRPTTNGWELIEWVKALVWTDQESPWQPWHGHWSLATVSWPLWPVLCHHGHGCEHHCGGGPHGRGHHHGHLGARPLLHNKGRLVSRLTAMTTDCHTSSLCRENITMRMRCKPWLLRRCWRRRRGRRRRRQCLTISAILARRRRRAHLSLTNLRLNMTTMDFHWKILMILMEWKGLWRISFVINRCSYCSK